MTPLSIQVPFPVFQDRDGQPLDNGYVWIGEPNLNPQTNPVVAYFDAALTIPAAQPLRTINGYVSRAGTPAKIYVDGADFSILVQDNKGTMVYNFPSGTGIGADACGLTYNPPFTGAVPTPVCVKLAETVSVKDFGAVGNGVANDAAPIQTALNYAIANDKALYFPEGTYIISGGDAGLTNGRIEPTIADGDSIVMFGAGPGKTIIKEKNGSTLAYGKFHMMLYLNVGAGETVNNIIIRDMTWDKNGASNGAEPSSYAWEQAHIISVATNATTGKVRYALFDNIEMLDKVGGGIVLAAGVVDNAIIRNCHARNFSGLFSQRGDFEFQASVENLAVEGCTGLYAQCEPDAGAPPAGVFPIAAFRDCVIDSLEFTAYRAAVTAQTIVIDNCVAMSKLTVRDVKLLARNSKFVVGSGNFDYWSRLAQGSLVDGCTIVNRYNAGTNSISSFYPRSETTLGGFFCDFVNCVFEPGAGASGTTTGIAINNSATYNGSLPYLVKFVDCTFSPLYQQTIIAYANGNYEMIRCKMAGWGAQAAQVGAYSSFIGKLTLESCDFSAVTATHKVLYSNSNALWELRWRGEHKYSEYSATYAAANPDLYTKYNGIFVSDSAPTGAGVKGMRVRVSNPTEGAGSDYVCLTNSFSASTWRMAKQFGVKKNTTANRPTLAASDIGAVHLDTTLDANGKPIWWTGTAWVDATGLAV